MADNLTVKEISELNNVSINDNALVLAYTDADGVGKTTFKDAKNYIGCNIDIEQTENAAGNGGTNKIKATVRNGTETETKEFTYKNGNGLNSVTKTESTDTNGLKSNTVQLKSNDATLIPDVSFTVKDGVGVKSSGQTTASTLSGELNEYTITLTDGTTNTIKVYNGRAGKDFRIKKTYTSISEMESDFSNTDIETYDFAMIDTGSVDDEDTGKLYYKNTDAWTYVGDLSGAQGVKGETGNGIASIENTLTDEGKIKVTITMTDGTTTEFLINNGLEYTAGNGIAISESNVVSVSDDIKTQIGLDKVDNTADSEKSVKYATSAGSADTATTCTGNSATATKLATARSISIGNGFSSNSVNFDGSNDISITVPNVMHYSGEITKADTDTFPASLWNESRTITEGWASWTGSIWKWVTGGSNSSFLIRVCGNGASDEQVQFAFGIDNNRFGGSGWNTFASLNTEQTFSAAKHFTSAVDFSGKLTIPTSQPSTLSNGDIWLG